MNEKQHPAGTILVGVSDPDEIEECRELDALDWNRYRVWKEHPYRGTLDFILFSYPAIDPPTEEFCERNSYDGDNTYEGEYYKPFKCVHCKRDIQLTEYAWWVKSKPYCEKCASELYMHTVPTVESHKHEWCGRCGCDIDDGEDVWNFPDEDPMCERCAAIEHRIPVWKQWFKQT